MDHQQQTAAGYNWPAMWTTTTSSTTSKRKHDHNTTYDSWEEQAFAEDAAGLLGPSGCVWPPRSYTCTFCRRDFSSAQALGGHMNVHRRDRARLNQFPPNTPQDDHNDKPAFLMSSYNHPIHKICPNPNGLGRPMSTRGMQVSSNVKPSSAVNFPQKSRLDGKRKAENEVSISLSLVVRRNLPVEEAKASSLKRRKGYITSPEPSPTLILISPGASSNGIDKMSKIDHSPKEVHGLANSCCLKEIDLELRLGG